MKLLISITLLCFFTAYSFAQKGVTNYWEIEVDNSEKKIEFVKEYNFKSIHDYSKKVIRHYYGFQRNMLPLFNANIPNKGFSIDSFTKFPIASFFKVGSFNIPIENLETAKTYFKPVLDSIFSNNNNDSLLHAELLIVGFTDEQLYENIKSSFADVGSAMRQLQGGIKEYQNNISYLRAKEIGELLNEMLVKNKFELHRYNNVIIDIKMIGKGVEKPEANREYSKQDDKRRIAKVYWRIIN